MMIYGRFRARCARPEPSLGPLAPREEDVERARSPHCLLAAASGGKQGACPEDRNRSNAQPRPVFCSFYPGIVRKPHTASTAPSPCRSLAEKASTSDDPNVVRMAVAHNRFARWLPKASAVCLLTTDSLPLQQAAAAAVRALASRLLEYHRIDHPRGGPGHVLAGERMSAEIASLGAFSRASSQHTHVSRPALALTRFPSSPCADVWDMVSARRVTVPTLSVLLTNVIRRAPTHTHAFLSNNARRLPSAAVPHAPNPSSPRSRSGQAVPDFVDVNLRTDHRDLQLLSQITPDEARCRVAGPVAGLPPRRALLCAMLTPSRLAVAAHLYAGDSRPDLIGNRLQRFRLLCLSVNCGLPCPFLRSAKCR